METNWKLKIQKLEKTLKEVLRFFQVLDRKNNPFFFFNLAFFKWQKPLDGWRFSIPHQFLCCKLYSWFCSNAAVARCCRGNDQGEREGLKGVFRARRPSEAAERVSEAETAVRASKAVERAYDEASEAAEGLRGS